MMITPKKIIGIGMVLLAGMAVVLGWQPISAATSRIVFGFWQTKINDGLVGYWPFEMGSTTQNIAQDLSNSGNSGAISGAGTSTLQAVGAIGQGMRFDGVDDFINVVDNSNLSFSGDFSAMAWVKFTQDYTGSNPGVVISKRLGSAPFDQWNIGASASCDNSFTGGTTLCFLVCNSSTCTGVVSPTSNNDGKWHHVAGVRSGTDILLYVDGAQVDSDSRTGTFNNDKPLTIGKISDLAGYYFNGSIDEVKVYDRALSAAEISYLNSHAGPGGFGAVKPPTKTGLAAYWSFDDCDSCTTVTDKSGNGNTGSMTRSAAATNLHTGSGKIGNGVSLNGSADTVVMSDASSLNPTNITISAWVKPTAGSLDALREVYRKQKVDFSSIVLLSFQNSGNCSAPGTAGCLAFGLNIGGSFAELEAGLSTNDWQGVWHHVAATYDGSAKKIYIDGVEVATISVSGSIDTTSPGSAYIGSFSDGAEFFQGTIDEVRIYSRGLTVDEVKNLYRDTSKRIINTSSNKQNNNGAVIDLSFDGTNVDWASSSAEIKDTSGTGKDGDAAGMSKATAVRTGVNGQAIYFDGSDDSITTTYNGPTTAPISFEFWAKPDTATPVGMFDSAPNVANVLRNYSNGTFEWWSGNPTISFTLTPLKWQHIVVVYWYDTARHIDYYLDGVLKATATGSTGNTIAWNGLRLGDINLGGAGRYAGALDNFRVYTVRLTAADVANLYAREKHGGR